jgi:hypothetical protein
MLTRHLKAVRGKADMRTVYEWDVEEWDADGNIQTHYFAHNYREALACAALPRLTLTSHIVLVCDDPHGRSRAYCG